MEAKGKRFDDDSLRMEDEKLVVVSDAKWMGDGKQRLKTGGKGKRSKKSTKRLVKHS